MSYKSNETLAGGLTFKVFYPVNEMLLFSPEPEKTIHLVVNPIDAASDELDNAINHLLPACQRTNEEVPIVITNIHVDELNEFKTVKELDAYLKTFIETMTVRFKDENQFSFIIDLMEALQTTYLRVKKTPKASDLRGFTRRCMKALMASHKVVIYVAVDDVERIHNPELLPGWALVDYLNDELVN